MAIGEKKSTGYSRRTTPSLGNTDLQSLGLGTIARPSASAPRVDLPYMRPPPKSQMTLLSEALKSGANQLQKFQDDNAKKWQTEAEVLTQNIIDRERAEGKSMAQIQQSFQNGEYPELESQLQYDTFNSAYGAKAAIDYFTSPQGEGYQMHKEFMDAYSDKPFEQRQEVDLEAHLSKMRDNFRNQFGGNNIKLQMGSREIISRWSAKQRQSFATEAEKLLNQDRVNTSVAGAAQTIKDMYESFPEEFDDNRQDFSNVANEYLRTYADNMGMNKKQLKQSKLRLSQRFFTDAMNEAEDLDTALRYFEIAESLLQEGKGAIPALINDNSTFEGVSGRESVVSERAIALQKQIGIAKAKFIKDANARALVDRTVQAIRGSGNFLEIYGGQDNNDIMGSGLNQSSAIAKGIDQYIKQHPDDLTTKIRNLDGIGDIGPKTFDYFTTQIDLGLSNMDEKIENFKGQNKAAFINSLTIFMAMKQNADPSFVDAHFPPNTSQRIMMERTLLDLQSGLTEAGPTISSDEIEQWQGLEQSVRKSWRVAQNPLDNPNLSETQLNEIVTSVTADLDNQDGFGLFGIKWFDAPVPDNVLNDVNSWIRQRAKQYAYSLPPDKIKNILEEELKAKLVIFDVDGQPTGIMPNNNSPLHQSSDVAEYAREQVNDYVNEIKNNNDIDYTLTIRQVPETDNYIIVSADRHSIPSDTKGNFIFQITREGVVQRVIKKRVGSANQ